MRVRGRLIRAVRNKKNLSQSDLANEICTQSTISNIEKKGFCDNVLIFSRICERLELDMSHCIIDPTEKYLIQLLTEAEQLCILLKHKQAYYLLKTIDKNTIFLNDLIKKKYLYLKGITCLLGKINKTEALFYLHQGAEITHKANIFNYLSLNALGIFYELEKEYQKAEGYFNRSLSQLRKFKKNYPFEACRIYYNSAKFYSEIKMYQKSVELCDLGIEICKSNKSIYLLDFLLYERAYNKRKLGENTTEDYLQAYYFSKFFNNKKAVTCLKHELKHLNINYS